MRWWMADVHYALRAEAHYSERTIVRWGASALGRIVLALSLLLWPRPRYRWDAWESKTTDDEMACSLRWNLATAIPIFFRMRPIGRKWSRRAELMQAIEVLVMEAQQSIVEHNTLESTFQTLGVTIRTLLLVDEHQLAALVTQVQEELAWLEGCTHEVDTFLYWQERLGRMKSFPDEHSGVDGYYE